MRKPASAGEELIVHAQASLGSFPCLQGFPKPEVQTPWACPHGHLAGYRETASAEHKKPAPWGRRAVQCEHRWSSPHGPMQSPSLRRRLVSPPGSVGTWRKWVECS